MLNNRCIECVGKWKKEKREEVPVDRWMGYRKLKIYGNKNFGRDKWRAAMTKSTSQAEHN